MSQTWRIPVDQLVPTPAAVYSQQGVPPGAVVSTAVQRACATAITRLAACADPVAILAPISTDEFATLYEGEGLNESRTPIADRYAAADALVLFAGTIGPAVTEETAQRFAQDDPAGGAMLDTAASLATDRLTWWVERLLERQHRLGGPQRAICYAPGYCGWDISGQGALFRALKPDRIGISLSATYLMTPLKSVSGVVLVGQPAPSECAPEYPACRTCTSRSCHGRYERVEGACETRNPGGTSSEDSGPAR